MKDKLKFGNKGNMEVKAVNKDGGKKPTVRKGED